VKVCWKLFGDFLKILSAFLAPQVDTNARVGYDLSVK
jgi:hypothetical protein